VICFLRSLAPFLPPNSLFFFGRAVLSSSIIVYFIDFFISLALGPLDPHASWLLFLLEIFISCSLNFSFSCCAWSPRATARSVFLLAFSRGPFSFYRFHSLGSSSLLAFLELPPPATVFLFPVCSSPGKGACAGLTLSSSVTGFLSCVNWAPA
jgi:hypothetical protein